MEVIKHSVITKIEVSNLELTSGEAGAIYSSIEAIREAMGREKFINTCPNLDKLMELFETEECV